MLLRVFDAGRSLEPSFKPHALLTKVSEEYYTATMPNPNFRLNVCGVTGLFEEMHKRLVTPLSASSMMLHFISLRARAHKDQLISY